MSKSISFRDLMVCEELSHVKNEIELLDKSNDKIVERILKDIGFDTDYAITYVPSKHRDMKNKIAVGFCAVGEISCNRNFVNSYLCSTEERIIAAGYQDRGLASELSQLSGCSKAWGTVLESESIDVKGSLMGSGRAAEDYPYETDWRDVEKQIEQLLEVRNHVRGSIYNDAGDLKTMDEYSLPPTVKKRRYQ